MINPFKTISISLCPNFGLDDVLLSFSLLLRPWKYFEENPQRLLESFLKKYLGRKYVFLFDSGRTSLYFLLKALGVKAGDEVAIQAFTCSVVPGAIIQAGAKPLFIDIDETMNLDLLKLREIISPKIRAVIIQHSFGKPSNVSEIQKICDENGVILIEDCAHALGNSYQGKNLGSFGKASFFSFGRDKVVSSVWGGAVTTDDDVLASDLEKITLDLPLRGFIWTVKQLLYPLLAYLIINTYGFLSMGKALHFLLRRFGLLSDALTREEKQALWPKVYYRGLPSPLCLIASKQLNKLSSLIDHRRKLAKYYAIELGLDYDPDSTYLRFNLEVDRPDDLRRLAGKQSVFLGDWYDSPVAPKGIDLSYFGYSLGTCPKAERLSKRVINLPTCPSVSLAGAGKVVSLIYEWKSKK